MKMRYFVVKSDQHVVEAGQTLYGLDTTEKTQRLVEMILREPVPVEVIVDAGDVADTVFDSNRPTAIASKESYLQAAQLFAPISNKTLYIPGNHDNPELLYNILGDNWSTRRAGCTTFQFGPITFVGVDMRTGPEATGFFRPETGRELEALLQNLQRVMIFVHYPWYETDNDWIEKTGRVTNGESFGAIITRHRQRIGAIFHGHLHAWWSGSYAGIPVYCSAGSVLGFHTEPTSQKIEKYFTSPLGYYLVGVREDGSTLLRPRFMQ